MKTNEPKSPAAEPKPGNLSVRDLAASLTKTAPASAPSGAEGSPTDKAPAKAGAKQPRREPAATTEGEPQPEPENPQTELEPGAEPETEPQPEPGTEEPQPEEPGAEPEEAAEPEAEPEADPEQPAKAALPEELQDAIQIAKGDGKKGVAQLLSRVHKLADERDTHRNQRLAVEEQNKQLRAELQEARKGQPEGAHGTASATHPEVAKVSQELANVDHWLGWCESNPDGGEVPDGKGGTVELDGAKVRQIRRDLENQRQELVARKVQTERDVKAAYDSQYAQAHKVAVEKFPWLKDEKSPEHQEMQTILRAFPTIKQSPDYEIVLGWMFKGRALDEAEQKARTAKVKVPVRKAPPAREPTPVFTEAPGGSAEREPGDKTVKEARSRFNSSGRVDDLAKMFAAGARVRRATK